MNPQVLALRDDDYVLSDFRKDGLPETQLDVKRPVQQLIGQRRIGDQGGKEVAEAGQPGAELHGAAPADAR